MIALELENVSLSYQLGEERTSILQRIDLKVRMGEMVAIQGPSGSGKSTLLYVLGCLLRPDSGRVVIQGMDMSDIASDELAGIRNEKIGFIFQQFHLLPKASVLENILLPTQYRTKATSKNPKAKAKEICEALGLQSRLNHMPNQLSGGQQQRVAIARALINDANLILADEPTGNLDSEMSKQTMALLRRLHESGKTIVIITHDPEVARQCEKIYHMRDGRIIKEEILQTPSASPAGIGDRPSMQPPESQAPSQLTKILLALVPLALQNLRRHRMRSALTMAGVTIGVAAVLAMVTLGSFTKRKILASYAELGVNTVQFYGYPNWNLRATDEVNVLFRFFDGERDIRPLFRVFPQIARLSPILMSWASSKVAYAGKSIDSETTVQGINDQALGILGRKFSMGRNFTPHHMEGKSNVCIIGHEIFQRLFEKRNPLGQVLQISQNKGSYGCLIIGVLASASSNKEWNKPNLQIFLPFTFYQAVTDDSWSSQIRQIVIQLREGADVEKIGGGIRAFFEQKYGRSGQFRVDSDSVLIAQMEKFLNLFAILLNTIAFVSLAVGGMGIANMMLVSVSERFREIGLRKAIGATDRSIWCQLLLESMFLCSIAGIVGVGLGFLGYEAVLYGASKLVKNLSFEWILDLPALMLALVSIVIVGIASGLLPALRAEKLQVIEALRSE